MPRINFVKGRIPPKNHVSFPNCAGIHSFLGQRARGTLERSKGYRRDILLIGPDTLLTAFYRGNRAIRTLHKSFQGAFPYMTVSRNVYDNLSSDTILTRYQI